MTGMEYLQSNHSHDSGPVHTVRTGSGVVRVLPFAMPIISMQPPSCHGLVPAHLDEFEDVCKLLHGPGCMGSDVQSMYVHPQLVSTSLLANMVAPGRPAAVAALMLEDFERMDAGQPSKLHKYLDLADDEQGTAQIRFMFGCVYTQLANPHGPQLPRHEAWEGSLLQAQVEAAIALDWSKPRGSPLRVSSRPSVLVPARFEYSLLSGFMEVVRQGIESIEGPIEPVLDFRQENSVELRLIGRGPVLSFKLSASVIVPATIEWLLVQVHKLLARRQGTWTSSQQGVRH